MRYLQLPEIATKIAQITTLYFAQFVNITRNTSSYSRLPLEP